MLVICVQLFVYSYLYTILILGLTYALFENISPGTCCLTREFGDSLTSAYPGIIAIKCVILAIMRVN